MANGKIAATAALGVFSLVMPALAQDAPAAPGPAPAAPATSQEQPATTEKKEAEAPTVTEETVRELPKWESYGAGTDPDRLDETFFRLAQDFVATSEVGVRRLGHVPIWPRGEMKVGNIRILPYLREGVEWETNLYKKNKTGGATAGNPNEEGRQTGWTHVNQVGLLADTLLNGGRTRVSASADSRWNVRYRQDQPDDWELDSQLGVSHRINEALWTSLGVAYERRSDPIEVETTDRFRRTNKRGFVRLGADKDFLFGSRLNYETGADFRRVDSREDSLDDHDRTEATYYLKVSYPFWKRQTRIFTRVTYRDESRQSDKINDGSVWGWDAGIEGSIPISEGGYRGLRGQVSFGFDHGEYDDKTYTDGSQELQRDDNDRNTSLRINAALQYIMSPKTSMDLRYGRNNQFSYHGNYQITDRVDYTFTHTITAKLVGRFQTYWEYTNPSSGYNSPTYASGERPRDQSRVGNVTRGGVGVGFRYPIEEWVDLDLSFDYERRNGYDHRDSFTNYRGILGVTFYFSGLNPPQKSALLDL